MPRPYKDKTPPESEQFGFGGEVNVKPSATVFLKPLQPGDRPRGLGTGVGATAGGGKGGDALITNL